MCVQFLLFNYFILNCDMEKNNDQQKEFNVLNIYIRSKCSPKMLKPLHIKSNICKLLLMQISQ